MATIQEIDDRRGLRARAATLLTQLGARGFDADQIESGMLSGKPAGSFASRVADLRAGHAMGDFDLAELETRFNLEICTEVGQIGAEAHVAQNLGRALFDNTRHAFNEGSQVVAEDALRVSSELMGWDAKQRRGDLRDLAATIKEVGLPLNEATKTLLVSADVDGSVARTLGMETEEQRRISTELNWVAGSPASPVPAPVRVRKMLEMLNESVSPAPSGRPLVSEQVAAHELFPSDPTLTQSLTASL